MADKTTGSYFVTLGGTILSTFFLLCLYGLVSLFIRGFALEYLRFTYIPIAGSVVASVSLLAFIWSIKRTERSFLNASLSLAGLFPYVVGCFMTFVLGAYGLVEAWSSFSLATLLRSIAFIIIGYKCVYSFWLLTEVAEAMSKSSTG